MTVNCKKCSQSDTSLSVLWAFKMPKKTIEDHANTVHQTRSLYLHNLFLSLTHTLSHKRFLVACLWSWDQPVSWAQCQLFCICWAYSWHGSGLAGICTKSDHPSYAMPVNCMTMQVFHDIASVTLQLIDWCRSCTNGITGPVRSEIHQRCLHRWCFTAVWSWNNEELEYIICTCSNLRRGRRAKT